MNLRAIILNWLIGKLNAWAHPEQAQELADYQTQVKAFESQLADLRGKIAEAQKQVAVDDAQLATDATQLQGLDHDIKDIETARGKAVADRVAADAAIAARPAGAIDQPLPGTKPD